jgi:hypothetical protein
MPSCFELVQPRSKIERQCDELIAHHDEQVDGWQTNNVNPVAMIPLRQRLTSSSISSTGQQFSLMRSLNRPVPVDMSGSVTTRSGPNHIDRDLLEIEVDAADRSRVMTLTPKGRRLLARAVPMVFAHRCGAPYLGLLTKACLAQKQLIVGRPICQLRACKISNLHEAKRTGSGQAE